MNYRLKLLRDCNDACKNLTIIEHGIMERTMKDAPTKLTTQEKALRINLSKAIYGSFAEIGAGQEVAANFFKVGGASGTVAKTISAYDMKFSDAIYGYCDRYVCEDRLLNMLNHEYPLLLERLPDRKDSTRFFAFADTVETLNYERTNEGQGWIGLRFQLRPNSEPNEIVIHVKMRDNDPLQQQFAIGILGREHDLWLHVYLRARGNYAVFNGRPHHQADRD